MFSQILKMSVVLGLLMTLPVYCSSGFDEKLKNDVCMENFVPRGRDLMTLANDGHQDAQDEIIGQFIVGGIQDKRFENINVTRWSMLLESAEYEDHYASFALRLNSEVIHQYFPKLFHHIINRAQLGVPAALTNLGYMYSKGLGVQKDDIRAVYCYKKAVKGEDVAAFYNLAKSYQLGRGISLNNYEAHSYFVKAAEKGYLAAQNELGMQYADGVGVPMDCGVAVEWLTKAARQGFSAAQNKLGVMCFKGVGVKQNIDEAINWMEKAAKHGHAEAFLNLGMIFEKYRNDPAVQSSTHNLNPDTIAAQYYLRAAVQNLTEAQYRFALFCLQGRGVALKLGLAYEWFERASEQSHLGAIYEFGVMLESGNVMGKDLSQAAKWYSNAAEQGCEKSRNALARICDGGFMPEDPREQLRFKILINRGELDAEMLKSVLYTGKKDPFKIQVGYASYYDFVPAEVTIFNTCFAHLDELTSMGFDNSCLAGSPSNIHLLGNALREYIKQVQKVSKLLISSPLMCTNFSLAPELMNADHISDSPFFNIYHRNGQVYFTMGRERVKAVSSLHTLFDNHEVMVDMQQYAGKEYLTKRAIWSAACKLKKQGVCEDGLGQALRNSPQQALPIFNTLGQVRHHLLYLSNTYADALKDMDVIKKSSIDSGKDNMFAVLKKAERRLQKEYQWAKDSLYLINEVESEVYEQIEASTARNRACLNDQLYQPFVRAYRSAIERDESLCSIL
jgi:TPR repeat protein